MSHADYTVIRSWAFSSLNVNYILLCGIELTSNKGNVVQRKWQVK